MKSLLFINGKVWQADGSFSEAFGVNNSHFDLVGNDSEAKAKANSYSEIIDLKGKLVIPGLIDGHLHLVKGSLMRRLLDCTHINSIEELKSAVKEYNQSNAPKWIIGGNLDMNKVLAGYGIGGTTENIADDLFSDLPLYITNYDYHSAICNTKALELSGLSGKLDEFTGEEIQRVQGKPNGIIREKALENVISALPVPTMHGKVQAAEEFIDVLHSYGITSVSDITLPVDLDVFVELYMQNKLKLRINSYIPFDEFNNFEHHLNRTKEIDQDYFSISGFKAFWDGALGSETALFSQNYKGRDHNGYKTEMVTSGRVYDLAKQIDSANMQMIIHAIGDLAVKDVLDLYESLPNTKKLRHRIEHAQHVSDSDIERFGKLGVMASVQPLHLKYDARTVYGKLPESLIGNTHNYLNIIKAGGIINFGTDFPIVEVDPFENLRIAATRKIVNGSFTPELCLTLNDCIKCYTINNAYSNNNDNAVGSISKGKVADFVIMDDDLFEMESDDISKARVYKTYLNGEEVYSA
ncbi:MAG: amidohydrolase [Ignavibacteria bacterium]|nr:amidohydrolase [Ignavibacteria bacterium]